MLRKVPLASLICLGLFLSPGNGVQAQTAVRGDVNTSRPKSTISQHDVLELTYTYPTGRLANPWENVSVSATFTTPTRVILWNGFYYDTNTYKVRFSPAEVGAYLYSVTLTNHVTGQAAQTHSGAFTSVASSRKRYPQPAVFNPNRLVYADGTIFNGLGFNDCWQYLDTDPDNYYGLYGAIGYDRAAHESIKVDVNKYFATYGQAGFNLLRFNEGNCTAGPDRSYPSMQIRGKISVKGNTYQTLAAQVTETLLKSAFDHGFHVWFAFFDPTPPFPDSVTKHNTAQMEAVERHLDYVMARVGAYVDVWELANESSEITTPYRSYDWYSYFANYIHSHDPYNRIVTNSNAQNYDQDYLDAASPHYYESWTTDFTADQDVVTFLESQFRRPDAKLQNTVEAFPVMFGEAGGQSVDRVRCNKTTLIMRLKNWAAFFNEAYIAYWNTSWRDNICPAVGSGPSNQYIGVEERQQARVLQDFTVQVDGDAIASRSDVPGVRVHVLRSSRMLAAYLHHFSDHTSAVTPAISLSIPIGGAATWIDPATGKILRTDTVAAGTQTLTTPSFPVDLALLIKQRTCLRPHGAGACGRVKPGAR